MFSAAPNGISFSSVPGGPSGAFAKVHINATSNNMQVYQTYFPLTAGKRYRLGFDAYSPTSRQVFVTVHKHNAPYGSYGFGEWIQLGPTGRATSGNLRPGLFRNNFQTTRLRFYFVYACAPGDDYYSIMSRLCKHLQKRGKEQVAGQPGAFLMEQNYSQSVQPDDDDTISNPERWSHIAEGI